MGVCEVSAQGNIVLGDLEIRPLERSVLVKGHDVALTPAEFGIVMTLAEHPGWVYSADQLSCDSAQSDLSPESISVLVSRLRHRLAEAGLADAVETVRGFGYRFRSVPAPDVGYRVPDRAKCDLHEAAWQLQEALVEVEHAGSAAQQCAATRALDTARQAIRSIMAQ